MRKFFTTLAALGLFGLMPFAMKAQVSEGGIPYSFNHPMAKALPMAKIERVSSQALAQVIAEDKANSDIKDMPYRFGVALDVNYSLENSGSWETLANGDRVWRMQISSPGAYSLNLNYSSFKLPKGAKFFVYTPDHKQVAGAYTIQNNKANGRFATGVIRGEQLILEYYEPANVANQGKIALESVVHGYRKAFNKDLRTYSDTTPYFNESQPCENNIVCPVGDMWENERHAVAIVLTKGGTSSCSGTLINNTRQDGTPYFLTANHCFQDTEDTENWTFIFNYESPTCFPTTMGRIDQSIQGCQVMARTTESDFLLLKLNETPPPSYKPYYAGWSNIDIAPDSITCIHHPSADVKKISFSGQPILSGTGDFDGAPENSHWVVSKWDDGVTEGGSSGSALFNKKHLVIGQLHGGFSFCDPKERTDDSYGKFAFSWAHFPDSSKQLKCWLDPENTGKLTLDGKDFSLTNTIDANIKELLSPVEAECSQKVVQPAFYLKNNGSETITSLDIVYKYDDNTAKTFNWTGNLKHSKYEKVVLPEDVTLTTGNHTFSMTLSNVNGSVDDNETDNSINTQFHVRGGIDVQFNLKTDANVITDKTKWWVISNETDTIVRNENLFASATTTENWCLMEGCNYKFVMRDYITATKGDGMGGTSPSDLTDDGNFEILIGGKSIVKGGGNFGAKFEQSFCVESTGINNLEFDQNQISVYPNPTTGLVQVNINGLDKVNTQLEIVNLTGSVVYTTNITKEVNSIDLSELPNGIYFVKIPTGKKVFTQRLVIAQ